MFEQLQPRLLLDGGVLISELMAINGQTLQDGDGQYSDWIEIHNSGTEAVSLQNWKLRDSNNTWTFPGTIVLGPGEFRIIFASNGRENVPGPHDPNLDPEGYLHTNFALKGSGEYLGLLDNTGAVVHEYDPYPAQTADISYGIAQDIDLTQFVASGDEARYLVPSQDAGAWTAPGYNDSGWATGDTGLGYADLLPGFAVRNYKANTTVGSLDVALAVISQPALWSAVYAENIGVINYTNEGAAGHYTTGEVNFPGFTGAMDDFAVEATALVTIPSAGQWSFGVNSDDGFLLELDDGTNHFQTSYPNPRGPGDTIATFDFPAAGVYDLRLVYYERGGGAEVELFAAQGAYAAFNAGAFHLVGDTAAGGLQVLSEPVSGGAGGSGFTNLIETDLQDEMKGTNASLLVRLPFTVEDPSQVESLTLKMRYDDGYVAYLNGHEVARPNAPATVVWNSAATAERTDAQAAAWENVSLTGYLGDLTAGQNVLAIQALNYAADDGDFLILPELVEVKYLGMGEHYFATATPGEPNTEDYWLHVGDTHFSHDRGFYVPGAPGFNLAITTNTQGAAIYYTTDGSEPTETHGTLYTGAIPISTTTVVRAAAFKANHAPSNVDTQTYLFLGDVLGQPANPQGFPAAWGGTAGDYEMDPDVVNNPLYSGQLIDALTSLPSVSIVTNQADLFGPNGIYTNSTAEGVAWERPTSVEWINTDGTTGFQLDAGLRIYGGAFRGMGLTRKHTFRLLFKEDYGSSKLDYPVFGDEGAATSFDTLILRAGANDAWNNWGAGNTQYVIDEFMRQTQLALGDPSAHGTFVHVYLNGLYWGLYNLTERPEADFAATYFGGEKENWDAINSGEPTGESSGATWNAMITQVRAGLTTMAAYQKIQGNNPDGTDNPTYDDLLDIDNYIDYMFSNFWGGTGDWPGHNWYAACQRPPDSTGFKSFNWDSEGAIVVWSNLNANVTGVGDSIAEPFAALRQNEEFRMLFADHVHRALFNDGPAAAQASYDRYKELADLVELAVIAESARWGDQAGGAPYTQATWAATRDYVLNTYMPQRSAIVLNQMKAAGLYPNVVAPVFSINGAYQHGGTIRLGDLLTIAAPAGAIYYTTDGTDPRVLGGAISPSALVYTNGFALQEGTHVKSRVYDSGTWSALNEATFYVDLAPNIRITEIMYHPPDPTPAEVAQGFTDAEDFEFIEVRNISADQTLPLEGLRFSKGILFTFGDINIAPGEYMVVVKNEQAFRTRYPAYAGTVAGEFVDTSLSNAGEMIELDAPVGGVIHQFTFQDGWYGHTDGEGFSLTVRDPQQAKALWDSSAGWRGSAAPGGSPGAGDTLPTPGSVVVSEVLAHSDDPYVDTIELHNVGDAAVNVSGWFLSDQKSDGQGNGLLTKYQIPSFPDIQPGGYLVLYEDEHFGGAFLLSELGDEVYLSSNAGGQAGGYREHVDFGASPRNVAIGLHVKSTGGTDFTFLSAPTFGSDNAAPYLEDLVLNEVLYHPDNPTADELAAGFINNDDFEFLEIANTSADTTYPLSGYYVGGGVGFTFGWCPADSFGHEAWTLEKGATATWEIDLPAGLHTYEVFARWDLLDALGAPRGLDGQAQYAVTHAGGTNVVVRDQAPEDDDEGPGYMDPDGWVSLGTYQFDGSGQVVLTRGTDNPDNWTIADQVKFVAAGSGGEVVVDDPLLDSWYTAHSPGAIGPGEYVVIVRDLAAFDARYGIAANAIPVAGVYTGNLANDGDKVKLFRAGDPEANGYIPYYRIDYVNYGDSSPWPTEADIGGGSLIRLGGPGPAVPPQAVQYGNDPASWQAGAYRGTPGAANIVLDRTPPTVPTGLAAHVTVGPDTVHLTWAASSDPESSVAHYVVYRDGKFAIAMAGLSWDDTDVAPTVKHFYQVAAVNRDGYASAPSVALVAAVGGIERTGTPDPWHIEVTFSEPLDAATAGAIGNYTFSGGELLNAFLAGDGAKLVLTTQSQMLVGQGYTLTLSNLTTSSGNEMPASFQVDFFYEARGAGTISREYWTGIDGNSINDLLNHPNFPDNPSGADELTSFEAPTDWADRYGTRIRGYIHPPVTGEYFFWIASDDNSILYLSTDSDPANKVAIASVPGWTSSREFTRYAAQQSAGVYLVAGQKYYIEALQKEGGGGDNLAVRWLMPGDEWEDPSNQNLPIPGVRLSPFSMDGTAPVAVDDVYQMFRGQALLVNAPGVMSNDYDPTPGPAAITVQVLTGPAHAQDFDVTPGGCVGYTPLSDFVGTDSFTYQLYDGAEYSQLAVVQIVVLDPIAVASVLAVDARHVRVVYTADVQPSSATTAGNYAVSGGLNVLDAALGADQRTVTLALDGDLAQDLAYVLTVNHVRDASGAHEILPNTQAALRHNVWQSQDVGDVAQAGSAALNDGIWTIEASGADIWGTADAFYFVYQPFIGDGMITVRAVSVQNTDPWAKAGVMIRETLDATSAYAAALVTPANGASFHRRNLTGQDSAHTTVAGPAAPYWLRLVREGDTFSAYCSPNGADWTLIGSDTVVMAQSTYVGLALTSHSDGVLCTAELDNLAVTVVDTEPPTADLVDVVPDPRDVPVAYVDVVFSEAVNHLEASSFQLTRDGGGNLLTGGEALETSDYVVWRLGLPDVLTALPGVYTLTLTAAGSGIHDAGGNGLALDASDTWTMELPGPTADILDVTPDPRNAPVSEIHIVFDEAVTGLTLGDLSLRRDGGAENLLTGGPGEPGLSTTDGLDWVLTLPDERTAASGTYTLTLTAEGSAIENADHEPLLLDASDTWLTDADAPTATIVPVTPDPRESAVAEIQITFSEPVTDLSVGDLTLSRDGGGNLLRGDEPLGTSDYVTWTLGGLTELTGRPGGDGFVAFNDHIAGAATHANATSYDSAGTGSGALLDIDTGAATGVTLTTSQVNMVPAGDSAAPAADTDAYAIFHGFVDFSTAVGASIQLGGAATYTHTFSGLDTGPGAPGVTYDFHGTAIRGEPSYTDRWTLITIVGAESFQIDHSTGLGIVTDGLEANQVALWTGYNSGAGQGFVVGWTGIDPGPDGQFSVVSSQYTGPTPGVGTGTASGTKGYGLTVIRLVEEAATGQAGQYVLTLHAAGSDIRDAIGNLLAADASDTWTIDTEPPTAQIAEVTPDPRTSAVEEVAIVFSEAVNRLDVGNLTLTRDGGAENLLTGPEPELTTADNVTWTLRLPDTLTAPLGTYCLTLTAQGSGIVDCLGHPLDGDAMEQWVRLNAPPQAAADAYATDEDTPLDVAAAGVLANDSDSDDAFWAETLTAELVAGPSHAEAFALHDDGSFTYTPEGNFHGTDTFTYQAHDAHEGSNTATVTITVRPVNDAPVAAGDAYDTDEDTPLSVTAPGVLDNDSDVDNDSLSAVLVAGPSHAEAFALHADGSFAYTPADNFWGQDSFTYRARDASAGSGPATVTITVHPVNDPPVANDDAYGTDEDPFGQDALVVGAPGVLANDSDVDGDSLWATLVEGPQHGTLTLNPDGSFTYTPEWSFSGADQFTYTAGDGQATSGTATVAITVDSSNDVPVAVADAYETDEDTPLSVAAPGVLANDTDADPGAPGLTAVLVAQAAHGTVALNADGSFLYTPAGNFHGTDGFTYKAFDGQAYSGVATVLLTVHSVNDAPVAADDAYETDEDSCGQDALTVPVPGVLGNDSDLESDTLWAELFAQASHGVVTLNADGSFVYTPAGNFHGSDTFTYKAHDAAGASAPAVVTITVHPVNDAPVAGADAYETDEDALLSVAASGVLANDTDVDGDAPGLTAELVAGPGHAQAFALQADGAFTYMPQHDFFGTDTFTYRAYDGAAFSGTATVTITVRPVNDLPQADAGEDLLGPAAVIDDDGDGHAVVHLDGSASGDVEGIVWYRWSDGRQEIAASGDPEVDVSLSVGRHWITLTVVDGDGAMDADLPGLCVDVLPPPAAGGPVVLANPVEAVTHLRGHDYRVLWTGGEADEDNGTLWALGPAGWQMIANDLFGKEGQGADEGGYDWDVSGVPGAWYTFAARGEDAQAPAPSLSPGWVRLAEASTTLYDGGLSGQQKLPGAQGWLYATDPLFGAAATQTPTPAGVVLDTTAAMGDSAGYFSKDPVLGLLEHPNMPVLDRASGYCVEFRLRLLEESHANADRAGFSVIALSEDSLGIELGFWSNEVWAQSGADFHHAEGAAFDTGAALSGQGTLYQLRVLDGHYALWANGVLLLTGALRDYSSHPHPVYSQRSFLFLGDDTGSGEARAELAGVWVGGW